MDTYNKIDTINQQISAINDKIVAGRKFIDELETEKKALHMELQYENAAMTDTDILPDELRALKIYMPKKYHIIRYVNYPLDCFVVGYDNHKFCMWGRTDLKHRHIFEIDKLNRKVISQTEIYYTGQKENVPDKMNDLQTAIDKAKESLADKWSDDLAFGIAIFYFWTDIFYNK